MLTVGIRTLSVWAQAFWTSGSTVVHGFGTLGLEGLGFRFPLNL